MSQLGPESEKFVRHLIYNGEMPQLSSMKGIDIGCGAGYRPIFDFEGWDNHSRGFDPSGKMPHADETFECVYSSHCLEHIVNPFCTLREWFRILKVNGLMVLTVPHQYLYERKNFPPSNWNKDHKRFYTPSKLLWEVEVALEPNSYRVRKLYDLDDGFDYTMKQNEHAKGNYAIVLILEKINSPMEAF